MRVKSKIWLETEDQKIIFSDGRRDLLRAIEELGSIHRAAQQMGMSYRAAWGKIKASEERLGFHLVATSAGGPRGGGAVLTEEGRSFLDKYEKFKAEANTAVDALFRSHFPDGRP
ncbi:MAG: LysR family transcriptional regulator [Bacillota bacterium]|nr:LysR family transcriptional regulator [Bacillota bacterium]